MWYSIFKESEPSPDHWSVDFPAGRQVRKLGGMTRDWRGTVVRVDHKEGMIHMFWNWDDQQVIFPINRWELVPV